MPQTDETPTTDFLLDEPAVAKDPGPFFNELRSQCPVAKTDAHGGFWMVSRYDDVREAVLRPEIFSSASGVTIPPVPNPALPCLEQDEPYHRDYRRPMQSWFSTGRMAQLEGRVRDVVTRLLDPVIDQGHGDIAKILAEPVPPVVIGLILGLPESDWPWFRERSGDFFELSAAGDKAGAEAAVFDLFGYVAAQLEERRAAPKDDMLSAITAIEVDGAPISMEATISLAFLILAAGHETTVGGIGGMLYRVAKDTGVRDRLLADPSLLPGAVEESLRLESPLMGLGRMTVRDTTLAGVAIPEAERVMLLYGAANRDPAVFEDPERFRIDRENNRHFGFGFGIHRCVGAPLARLEMKVVLEEVLRRMPAFRLESDELVEVDYHFSRMYSKLPVVW